MPKHPEAKIPFTTALTHLTQANQHFLEGSYPETMTSCRKAAESIQDVMKSYINSLKGDKDHSLRRDNIDELYSAIRGFLSIGSHPGHSGTRPEATLALSICKDFLSFVSKLEVPIPAAKESVAP